MNTWTKVLATAGAVGALGIAGSAGTFAAFTSEDSGTQQFQSGNVTISGGFELPTIKELGTLEAATRSGKAAITNNGTEPVNVYMDFDGPVDPVDKVGEVGYPARGSASNNLLAENILVGWSYDPDATYVPDYRFWRANDAGYNALKDTDGSILVLNPGQTRTVYFRTRLREGVGHLAGLDNAMQNKTLDETLHVKAIEAGGTLPADQLTYDSGL